MSTGSDYAQDQLKRGWIPQWFDGHVIVGICKAHYAPRIKHSLYGIDFKSFFYKRDTESII